jgi:putative peptide zinc metalloprotease protein
VKDPVQKKYYQIGSDEYALCQLLDGGRTSSDICSFLQVRLSIDIDKDEVESFITKLDALALLESSRLENQPGRVTEFSFLCIRFKIMNPGPAIDLISRYAGFLFSLPALVVAVPLIGWALYLTISNPNTLFSSQWLLTHKSNLFVFYLAMAVIMTCHEIGHAVVCKRRHGQVNEMGVMLLYFIPCFYTDVSDIYLMEKKKDRIAVIIAGPAVELFLWALGTLCYFFYDTQNTLSRLLYIVMMTSGLRSILINFNPFIRVDGYYLIEEIFNQTNLMTRSRQTLLRFLKNRILKNNPPSVDSDYVQDSFSKRGVLLVYGALSLLYAIALAGFVVYLFILGLAQK